MRRRARGGLQLVVWYLQRSVRVRDELYQYAIGSTDCGRRAVLRVCPWQCRQTGGGGGGTAEEDSASACACSAHRLRQRREPHAKPRGMLPATLRAVGLLWTATRLDAAKPMSAPDIVKRMRVLHGKVRSATRRGVPYCMRRFGALLAERTWLCAFACSSAWRASDDLSAPGIAYKVEQDGEIHRKI
eukprot:1231193-Rhodomonas_salina.1